MSDIASDSGFADSSRKHLGKALYQNGALTAKGLSERLFALLFSGLVYPQIWEDPEIDMEAMALEVPVVASRIAGLPKIVAHGENGVLIDAASGPQLEGELERLTRDAAERNRLGLAGRRTIEEPVRARCAAIPGKIAEMEGVTTRNIYPRYDLELAD